MNKKLGGGVIMKGSNQWKDEIRTWWGTLIVRGSN